MRLSNKQTQLESHGRIILLRSDTPDYPTPSTIQFAPFALVPKMATRWCYMPGVLYWYIASVIFIDPMKLLNPN